MLAAKAAKTLVAVLMLGLASTAGADVALPPLTGRVVDQAATLTSERKATLQQALQSLEEKRTSQIDALNVPTSEPETIEQYALRVAQQWKVGRKKVDDGAVLVVAKNDRTVRIEIGYGLEGVLTDVTRKRNISELIVPRFKEGEFYAGFTSGVDPIIRVIGGGPLPIPNAKPAIGMTDIQRYIPSSFFLRLC